MSTQGEAFTKAKEVPGTQTEAAWRVMRFLIDRQNDGPFEAETITLGTYNDTYVGGKTVSSALTSLRNTGLVEVPYKKKNSRDNSCQFFKISNLGLYVFNQPKGMAIVEKQFATMNVITAKRADHLRPIREEYDRQIREETHAVACEMLGKKIPKW